MKHVKLVVFDLGGTIIEDAGHVPAAFEAALRRHGFPVSAAEIARWRGASKRETIRRAMESTGVASAHRVANVGDTTNDLHTHILESAALVPDALGIERRVS